jgi:subtilase family serine protease
MPPRIFHSFAAIALIGAAASFAFATSAEAQRAQLLKDAQSIPARGGGSIVIPASSLVRAETDGLQAHTNVRFFAPAQSRAAGSPAGKAPFPGLNFETPASLACVYGLATPSAGCNPNTAGAVAAGGSRAIAIVDAYHYPTALADLKYYSQQFGLPAPTSSSFQVVFASGVQPARDFGWELEMALDIQMAHAMAPNAKIYLVEAASNSITHLLAAVDKAAQLVAAAGGGQVSMSWGSSEFASETAYDFHFARPGVTFFAATGDEPGVQWPSASANVVAVGGTSLSRQLGTMSFLHHASWADGGGGTSAYVMRPSYQSSIAGLVGAYRGVPDISAVADPSTGVWVYDSGNGGWLTVGGTSAAAPLVAGIVNSSGHFYASSAAQLGILYQNNANSAGNYAKGATGYCGPQAAFSVSSGWNACMGVGSPKSLASQ